MDPSSERSISIIMSAYNEEDYIESAVKMAQEKLRKYNFDYEILIFNDASTDNTGAIADWLARKDSKVKVFHNVRNMNLGYNFARGIRIASKVYCGSMPAHGLIAPESYDSILLSLGKHQTDVLIAYIANTSVRPLYRRFVSWFNTALLNMIFGFGLQYYHLNFFRTDLLKKLPMSTTSYALMVELLVYALTSGATYIEVPFYRKERSTGKSKALRIKNIIEILKTYGRLFWHIRILNRKINLKEA